MSSKSNAAKDEDDATLFALFARLTAQQRARLRQYVSNPLDAINRFEEANPTTSEDPTRSAEVDESRSLTPTPEDPRSVEVDESRSTTPTPDLLAARLKAAQLGRLTPPPNVSTAPEPSVSTAPAPNVPTAPAPNVPAIPALANLRRLGRRLGTREAIQAQVAAGAGPSTWPEPRARNPEDVIQRPLQAEDFLFRKPQEDEPLFPGKEKVWYLAFLSRWTDFPDLITEFYDSEDFEVAFAEIIDLPITPPRAADASFTEDSHGSERLGDYFQRKVLEPVGEVCNMLLQTTILREIDAPEWVFLSKGTDEDLGNEDCPWEPKFVLRMGAVEGDDETRLIGHAEYLGGRSGALTWATLEGNNNSWGSLRCVLGDIAQWMLMGGISYSFLTSIDEVIFLKLEIFDRVETVNIAAAGEEPEIAEVESFKETWLYYSDPVKHTDVFNAEEGTVPVRLALLYLMHMSATAMDWQLPEDLGSALQYFPKTEAGEKYRLPPLDFMSQGA